MPGALDIKFKFQSPKGFSTKAFLDTIEKGLQKEADRGKQEYSKFVDTWQSKPRFRKTLISKRKQGMITVKVTPTGDAGLLQIMDWVIHGTKATTITPHGNYPLRFAETFTPKTQPGIVSSFPGGESGEVRAWSVEHPGIKPRFVIGVILFNQRDSFIKGMELWGKLGMERGAAAGSKQ